MKRLALTTSLFLASSAFSIPQLLATTAQPPSTNQTLGGNYSPTLDEADATLVYNGQYLGSTLPTGSSLLNPSSYTAGTTSPISKTVAVPIGTTGEIFRPRRVAVPLSVPPPWIEPAPPEGTSRHVAVGPGGAV